jgi:ribosome-binding protein aMBF1 (putative translation factor)
MRLSEMGLEPTTLACLHRGGINTTYYLLEHTYRELIWHSEITPEALYDILRALRRHDMALKPATKGIERPVSERNLEVFRLRVVEGCTLRETGEQVGIGVERVRQVLASYFGLRGKPPAVKARPHHSENRSSPPDCEQLGRAIQRLRSAKGLAVDDLAATINVSAEQLARIEDGLRDPTWTTLSRLAIALDTTAALLAYAIEVEKQP